jgi:hypothetical protein
MRSLRTLPRILCFLEDTARATLDWIRFDKFSSCVCARASSNTFFSIDRAFLRKVVDRMRELNQKNPRADRYLSQ